MSGRKKERQAPGRARWRRKVALAAVEVMLLLLLGILCRACGEAGWIH